MHFLDGTAVPSEFLNQNNCNVANLAFCTYQQQDQLLVAWLLASMSSPLLTKMVGLDSSVAIWGCLLTHFASHTRAMVKKFRLLLKTPKNDKTITTYITNIKKIAYSLVVVGSPLSTTDHVDVILDGLSADYDGFITSILSRQDPYTVDDLEALLLAQEERFEKHKLAHDSILQVNNVSFSWNLKNQYKKKPSTCPFRGGRSQHPTGFRPPSPRPPVGLVFGPIVKYD
ncbi:uncharacterized protein [Phaseolus vulgaris]|uniref:uncharacterized protein n=1 Tax=Phaseolus vulgaris TaxID=3885 RepID=UPI0035CB5034